VHGIGRTLTPLQQFAEAIEKRQPLKILHYKVPSSLTTKP